MKKFTDILAFLFYVVTVLIGTFVCLAAFSPFAGDLGGSIVLVGLGLIIVGTGVSLVWTVIEENWVTLNAEHWFMKLARCSMLPENWERFELKLSHDERKGIDQIWSKGMPSPTKQEVFVAKWSVIILPLGSRTLTVANQALLLANRREHVQRSAQVA